MRKSRTILDFFGKSPSSNAVSPNEKEKSPSEKVVVKISETPSRSRDTKKLKSTSKIKRTSPKTVAKLPASASKDNCKNIKDINSAKKRRHDENDHDTSENSTSLMKLEKEKEENSFNLSHANSSHDNEKFTDVPTAEQNSDTSPVISSKQVKRRKIIIASDSDDSEDEYKPEKDSDDTISEESEVSESESPEKVIKKTPKLKKVKQRLDKYVKDTPADSVNSTILSSRNHLSLTSLSSLTPKSKFSDAALPKRANKSSDTSNEKSNNVDVKGIYLHERLEWLLPENRRDKNGRKTTDPDYDPKSLLIPGNFKQTLTPGLKQWWDIKSDHFDTVLFFKVGKFYELYHMDAVIGVKELDLSFMKGDVAHAGFPEVAFGKFSDILIEKGYKVARVEQTETPQMMEQRCKAMPRSTKYDRVVRREVCQVTSKGTKTLSHEEWCNNIGSSNNFLLSICEKRINQDLKGSEYGICFIDTTIGKFTLGQFKDDRHQSRLLSLVAVYPPAEILFEKSSVSQKTLKLFESNLVGVSKQALLSSSFWDAAKTLTFLAESGYFKGDKKDIEWPDGILQMLDKDDRLYQTPLKEYELAFKSLGACIWYLKQCFIDDCLLTMKLFEVYKPVDETVTKKNCSQNSTKFMILDNVTLHNLAIVPTQPLIKSEETLFGTLNSCETSFGKRELRKWLCSPLYQPDEIYDRLNAIDDLITVNVLDEARKNLGKLPDLERLLNKIHVHGLVRNKDHPDSRAILYEMEVYNKRKIADLLSALDGFKEAANISLLFEPYVESFKSNILKKCISTTGIGLFPPLSDTLTYFFEAFDQKEDIKQGSIIPRPGVDENYDSACKDIEKCHQRLKNFRHEQSCLLKCEIKYVNAGKNRYLIEVPENKKIPSNYEFLGGRKGFKRFYTEELKAIVSDLISAEEARDSALRDTTRSIFEQFDKHYTLWQKAVQCLSILDVLLSLATYCKNNDEDLVRPVFQSSFESGKPHLEIIDGRHPTFVKYYKGKDYIPNSIYIGEKENSRDGNKGGMVILVTGPNMGGKSTLMRQTGTLIVMAHLGCYVPAKSMVLTPVDRIFTRVGANDQIFKGESTFFVESSETASILHHATKNSFVLIDELGRGTATYDGTAIANATANHLANIIGCRTLFSTHYHTLVEDFRCHPNVGLGHMACLVEEDSNCPTLEKVTFLYKFVDGACPKSYGFNVAILAGIDKEIVRKGYLKSQQMDYGAKLSKCLRKVLAIKTAEEVIEAFRVKLREVDNE